MQTFTRLTYSIALAAVPVLALLHSPARANDPCVANGGTLVCSGNQSGGVLEFSGLIDTLKVSALTSEIATVDQSGIFFFSPGKAMTLYSETSPFGISTTGDYAPGIEVDSKVTIINHAPTFTSADILVVSDGMIVTRGEESYGIGLDVVTAVVHSLGPAAVVSSGPKIGVLSNGNIVTHGVSGHGVDAFSAVSASAAQPGSTAEARGGDMTVEVRQVETFGENAIGVYARQNLSASGSDVGQVVGGHIDIEASQVRTHGPLAAGVAAFSRAMISSDNAVGSTSAITVETESVETFGEMSPGVSAGVMVIANASATASVTGRELFVTNKGLVSTHATLSHGIFVGGELYVTSTAGQAYARSSAVQIDNLGRVVTRGAGAFGIYVMSEVVSEAQSASPAIAISEAITMNSNSVEAYGDAAVGIGVLTSVTASGAVEGQAYAGDVAINSRDVTVTGVSSVGISAVSVAQNGSGSGVAQAGDVAITSTGTLSATGLGSIGILAGSGGVGTGAAPGDVGIHIASGSVSGETAGIIILSNGENEIVNFGSISSEAGNTIVASDGDDTIENAGLIIGSVFLDDGANAFNHHASGVFASGDFAIIGQGNVLTNAGTLTPGGKGRIATTEMTGNFVQTSTGRYAVDVDFGTSDADKLSIEDLGSAMLAGTVVASPIVSEGMLGASHVFHILSAEGGVTDNGITARDTAVVDYGLLFDAGGHDLYLQALINFAPAGLNGNQRSIGSLLNMMQTNYGPPEGWSSLLTALMTLPTNADLARAYDQITAERYVDNQKAAVIAAHLFANEMMSCRVSGSGSAAIIKEGECLWARARAHDIDNDRTASNIGSQSRVGAFSAGLQVALAPDWKAGVAVGYDIINGSTTSGASSEGERVNVGGVVKYNPGSFLLAAGALASWGDTETEQQIGFAGFAALAQSKHDSETTSGWVHAAYLIDQGGWYLKPQVDARVTRVEIGSFVERGAGVIGLAVDGASNTVFSVSPALEIGTDFRFDSISVWRPFLRAGVTWLDSDSFTTTARFVGAPAGLPGFRVVGEQDDLLLDLSAGVDIVNEDGVAMRVQYDGRFGDISTQNSIGLKGSVPF